MTNKQIDENIKNHNILTGNLAQYDYKTFFDGKNVIAYKLDDDGWVIDEMTISKDDNTNKFYCYQIYKNEKSTNDFDKYKIEIFYHNQHDIFTDERILTTKQEIKRHFL